jgi:hypothetical protein
LIGEFIVATEPTPVKLPKIPLIPLILVFLLVAVYIIVVLVPAFSKVGGVPDDVVSLIWPPALIVIGFSAMMWGRSWLARKAAETK